MLEAPLPWFTPTRVGTAHGMVASLSSWKVHPHASGDSSWNGGFFVIVEGSPPREWGQLMEWWLLCHRGRFTPTRVGTARMMVAGHRLRAVHPHASGDSPKTLEHYMYLLGSPPTRVGTAPSGYTGVGIMWVHPHASGDSWLCRCWKHPCRGSPPREWGQLMEWWLLCHRGRFTPTRVGTAFGGHRD